MKVLMEKIRQGLKNKRTKLGQGLIKGLKEAIAFENNRLDLKTTTLKIPEKSIRKRIRLKK